MDHVGLTEKKNSIRVFFHGHWRLTGQLGKGGYHLFITLYLFTPCHEHSDTCFPTLHVTWLSLIFNRTTCIYQAANRWYLPAYRIFIWLIDDVMLFFVCLLVDLIHDFCYRYLTLKIGGPELASTIILVVQAMRNRLRQKFSLFMQNK